MARSDAVTECIVVRATAVQIIPDGVASEFEASPFRASREGASHPLGRKLSVLEAATADRQQRSQAEALQTP